MKDQLNLANTVSRFLDFCWCAIRAQMKRCFVVFWRRFGAQFSHILVSFSEVNPFLCYPFII